MLEIDGGRFSGSGTIVRYGLALAAVLRQPIRIINIRAKRKVPGLRPQHLAGVRACETLTRGRAEHAKVGAREITFHPGPTIHGGRYTFEIGTAGSTTMLAYSLLPLGLFADCPCHIRLVGGVFQDYAPGFFLLQHVLLPLLQRMGVAAELRLLTPGYVPRGSGVIELDITPLASPLKPIELVTQGTLRKIEGIAIASRLKARNVAPRMAAACQQTLLERGLTVKIVIEDVNDTTSAQPGAALAVWGETDAGCLIGADMAGALGRPAERIGQTVAYRLLEDLRSGATVDRHVADQLILFAALAHGTGRYRIPQITEHVETNLWLIDQLLGATSRIDGQWIEIRGSGIW
ncbi:MAG TPA: RNA 3'-terminal phosphate cyclase [Nitrospiria bacterium]|nr:RNA 3'-terminal phosphate cyclase [Nitrospiria bacterium]